MSITSWRVAVIEFGYGVIIEELTESQKAARFFRNSDCYDSLGKFS